MTKQPVQFPFNGGPQQGGLPPCPPLQTFFRDLPLSTTKAQVHNCHFPICGSRFYFLSSDSIVRVLSLSLSFLVFNAFPYAPFSSFANAAGIKLFDRFGSESCFIVVARATGIARLSKDSTVPNRYRCNSIFFHSSLSLFSFCLFVRRMIQNAPISLTCIF